MHFFTAMNRVEWVCCLLGVTMQIVALVLRKRPAKELLLAGIIVLPVTMLAASAFTQFLGWDESYIFYDIVNFHGERLSQWEQGAFRTSTALLGPLLFFLQSLLPLTKDMVLVLATVLHWLLGLVLITLTVDQVLQLCPVRKRRGLAHALVYAVIMALPVTVCALKTLNYDLISMVGGVLGMLWCVEGISRAGKKKMVAGIVLLTLATQEKLIAAPLLWLFLVGIPVRMVLLYRGLISEKIAVVLRWALMTTMVSFGTVLVSFALVYATHGPNAPVFNTDQLFTCWKSLLWPLLRIFGVYLSVEIVNKPLLHELPAILMLAVGIIAVVAAATLAIVGVVRAFWCRVNKKVGLNTAPRILAASVLVVLVLVTVTGVIAQYTLDARICPAIPIATGYYQPSATFNAIAQHFGCRSLLTHTIASIGWECAVFLNAFPTVLLLLLFAGCIIRLHKNCAERADVMQWLMGGLALLFLIFPLLYGVAQMPPYARYLNLFIEGAVVTVVPSLFRLIERPIKLVAGVVIVALLLLLVEIAPFQPLETSFRPFWSNPQKSIAHKPSFGMVTPWYPGWGEELWSAYHTIQKNEAPEVGNVRLYYNFPAALIRQPATVVTSAMPHGLGSLSYRYTDRDYYIISRNGIASYSYIKFPNCVQPMLSLADRGFVKAWVYRGSDLQRAGFRF